MKLFFLLSSLIFANVSVAGVAPFHIKMALGNDHIAVAEAEIRFEPNAEHYKIQTNTRLVGFYAFLKQDKIAETTLLKKGENQYLPYQYDFKQTNSNDNKTLHYEWDYKNKKVYQTRNGKKQIVPLYNNAYDTNSIILGFSSWLKDTVENNKAKGGTKTFYFHSKKGATQTTYKMGKEETLSLPYGTVKAVKFYPVNSKKGENGFTFWISAEKGYIPVKYVKKENGKVKVKVELKKIY